jgi:hypothetical protein
LSEFVAAFDESSNVGAGSRFFYGGWAAKREYWDTAFSPAWTQDVLDSVPQIPYLHMSSLFQHKRRQELGLNPSDIGAKLRAAARVLYCSGQLMPVVMDVSNTQFDKLVRRVMRLKNAAGVTKETALVPDYICFVSCAIQTMLSITDGHQDATRVDFLVEKNRPVTSYLKTFTEDLLKILPEIDCDHLVAMVGALHEAEKESIPCQAADFLCWHARNARRGTLDAAGRERYLLATGSHFSRVKNRLVGRTGLQYSIDDEMLKTIGTVLNRA